MFGDTKLLVAVLIGILILLIFLLVWQLTRVNKFDIAAKRAMASPGGVNPVEKHFAFSNSRLSRAYQDGLSKVVTPGFLEAFAKFLGIDFAQMDAKISASGLSEEMSAIEVVICKFLGLVAFVLGFLFVLFTKSLFALIVVIGVCVCLLVLPEARVNDAINERNREIEDGLPRFIEQVNLCCTAGATIRDSLIEVSDNTEGPLGEIFRNAFYRSGYAITWQESLLEMARALRIESLEDFVSNVVLASTKDPKTIGEMLTREVVHINKLDRARGLEQVAKLEARLSPLQMVFFLVPIAALILIPTVLQIIAIM